MIIWLASYPKSGNTWVRSFLASYIYAKKKFEFKDLANIETFPSSKQISFIRKKFGDYKFIDLASYWNFFQTEVNKTNNINFLKTHNALVTIKNFAFTNITNSFGLIYIIRDPRDIVVSYSHHLNLNYEETFQIIKNMNTMEKTDDLLGRTLLSNWSNHYNSWKGFPLKKLFIKYEDLVLKPLETFSEIIKYLNDLYGLPINNEKIKSSIENVKFTRLKSLEAEKGFNENPNQTSNKFFFREGKIDQWKKLLSDDLIKKIEREFQKEMIENNYLNFK